MNPRLIARDGPLKGSVLGLDEGDVSLGRHAHNRLRIADLSLSRQHCMITGQGGVFRIRDLDSRNGTFVNGMPVKERLLAHGDEIRIGNSLLLFLLAEDDSASQLAVRFDDRRVTGPTVILRPEKLGDLALKTLLKISTVVNSAMNLRTLERQLLENIFEAIPAQRGAILLTGEAPQEFSSVFSWERRQGSVEPFPVSGTVVRRVLQEKAGVLSNDVLKGDTFGAAKSLADSQISSLLAAPMLLYDKILGVIYLDSSGPSARLEPDHLQLVTAIAGVSAVALENLRHVQSLESENQRLQEEMCIEHSMVGEGAAMRAIYERIAKIAPINSTVLITGESGTGKELAARAIHKNSPRSGKPFVAINCAALTETLLENELFGHEKGAFTGAFAQKRGKLEVADGGTVFLDEIGELSLLLQPKLLRVLQERELERVGGTRLIPVDIRLIAATNKELAKEVKAGNFRQDLFYRLNVVALHMPPLREHREDIPLLATHFAAKYSDKMKRAVRGVSAKARTCLSQYDWPGNIRELENAIERAVVLGSTEVILPEDLPEAIVETQPVVGAAPTKYHEAIVEAKKKLILNAIERARGNYTEAAKLLGVHPNYLHRLIRNLSLKKGTAS